MSDITRSLASAVTAPRLPCPDLLDLPRPQASRHIVQFYEDETFVIENVSFMVARSLSSGDSSILIATRPHLDRMEAKLSDAGFDLRELHRAQRYIALDAAETLSRFLVDQWPDETKFKEVVGGVVRQIVLKSANDFTFAFGEMVALLCSANNVTAALRLEQLWNELAGLYRFSLCCAYPLSSLTNQPDIDAVFQICAEHCFTIPAEGPL